MSAPRHVGGGWYEVDTADGTQRVRGRDAARQAAGDELADPAGADQIEVTRDVDVTEDGPVAVSAPTATETFSGPALSFTLTAAPHQDTLVVAGPSGPVDVHVVGRQVFRRSAHFGRGKWTVTYQPV